MVSIKASVLAAMLFIPAMSPGMAQIPAKEQTATSYSMDAHTFTFALPKEYKLAGEKSPSAESKIFSFSTEPRADGTSGLIMIVLFDQRKLAGQSLSLDQFVTQMVASVSRKHTDWKSTEGSLELIGVKARRVEWSGTFERVPNEKYRMRGVMILGIKDDVGFWLQVRCTESQALQNLLQGENALKTFVLKVKR